MGKYRAAVIDVEKADYIGPRVLETIIELKTASCTPPPSSAAGWGFCPKKAEGGLFYGPSTSSHKLIKSIYGINFNFSIM